MKRFAIMLALVLLVGAVPAYAGDSDARSPHIRRATSPAPAIRALSVESDDDIPGVQIASSPIAGALDTSSDVDDVYSVYLEAGQRISAAIVGDPGTDFDVLLFGPEASTVYAVTGQVEDAATSFYPDALTYDVGVTGVYYLDAYAYSGAGEYSLSYSVGEAVPVVLGPDDDVPGVVPAATPLQGSLDAAGDCDDVYGIALLPGQTLVASVTAGPWTDFDLYLYDPAAPTVIDSPEWLACAATSSYPDGLRFTAKSPGTYFLDVWAFRGAGDYVLSWVVKSRHRVSSPTAPKTVRRGARFKLKGRIGGVHSGNHTVRVFRWRKTPSGAWKSYGFVRAQADGSGGYSCAMKLGRRGVWRLRAHAAEDPDHTGAWSQRYTYVRVR